MPLAFPSKSHGTIAFGFFNIETDMLLLESLFFFADRFCHAVVETAERKSASIEGWRIPPERIGNLHGAIAGDDLSGFIGATYERWPFPADPAGFKQSPQGDCNQAMVTEIVESYGERTEIVLDQTTGEVRFAEYAFTEESFAAMVDYVDRGGYPRWRDEQRPDYVREMMASLSRATQ